MMQVVVLLFKPIVFLDVLVGVASLDLKIAMKFEEVQRRFTETQLQFFLYLNRVRNCDSLVASGTKH